MRPFNIEIELFKF